MQGNSAAAQRREGEVGIGEEGGNVEGHGTADGFEQLGRGKVRLKAPPAARRHRTGSAFMGPKNPRSEFGKACM